MAPALGAIAGVPLIETAKAQSQTDLPWRHATSLFGDIKYPADFKRFDYVNPAAPKGGTVRQYTTGTFDNFNLVVDGVKGALASPVTMIYEQLSQQSLDEAETAYGQLAESVAFPDDRSYVIYRLYAQARWHDGKPVTPEDVIFSFEALKKNSPQYSAYFQHIVKCEKISERDVKFTFDGPGNRELPMITGQVTVMPKHFWEGTDAQGRKRDISQTTLEVPLGSGPYRVKEFVALRIIGARISRSISARTISTSSVGIISATTCRRAKPSRRTQSTGCPNAARRNGRSPTTSPPRATRR
jgi:microcin C transport system substrate-binding protein